MVSSVTSSPLYALVHEQAVHKPLIKSVIVVNIYIVEYHTGNKKHSSSQLFRSAALISQPSKSNLTLTDTEGNE